MSIVSNRSSRILFPRLGSNSQKDLSSCLDQLNSFVNKQNTIVILRATFFVDARNGDSYEEWRTRISKAINSELLPVYSVVAQPPMEGSIVLEIDYIELTGQSSVELKESGPFKYWCLSTCNSKELIVSNCSGFSNNTKENANLAFDSLSRILEFEKMNYSDIIRQWNYVGNIVLEYDGNQNYQIFNDVRSIFYNNEKWSNGFPAATGIGMSAPGIVIDVNVVQSLQEVEIVPISNPHQIDAHDYTDKVLVGDAIEEVEQRTSPKFERAKAIYDNNTGIVYISGTASIYGEKTEGIGDAAKQTEITIENINTLVDRQQQEMMGKVNGFGSGTFAKLRAYVKYEKDFEIVANKIKELYPDVAFNIVIADVCREALLVEIEGEYHFQVAETKLAM